MYDNNNYCFWIFSEVLVLVMTYAVKELTDQYSDRVVILRENDFHKI